MTENSQWTIEDELIKITSKPSWVEAAISLGLSSSSSLNGYSSIDVFFPWRVAYETAVLGFKINDGAGEKKYILKCAIPPSFGVSPNEIVSMWIKRRHFFEQNSISAPRLYYWGNGEIIEDYIPYSLREYLSSHTPSDHLLKNVFHYAELLDEHGFQSNNTFDDLRTDGNDLYIVDFGSDLGEPNSTQTRQRKYLDEITRWLASI